MATSAKYQPPAILESLLGQRQLLLAACLLAFLLRVFLLEHQSLWWDELARIVGAQRPSDPVATRLSLDIHPPLYLYLLHYWMLLAGSTEFAARYFSVLFGVLQIPVLAHFGRRLFGERIGLISAFLAALSPPLIHEAQEARMYSLLIVITLLSGVLLWRGVTGNRIASWLGYGLLSAAGLYIHYSYSFALLFQNLFLALILILRPRANRFFVTKWITSQALALVLFLPQLPIMLAQLGGYIPPDAAQLTVSRFVLELWKGSIIDLTIEGQAVGYLLLFAGVLALAGAIWAINQARGEGQYREPALFTLVWAVIPWLAYGLVVRGEEFLSPRYVIVVLPGVLYLLALGIWAAQRSHRFLGMVATAVLTLTFGIGDAFYFFDPHFARDDVRGLMAYLSREAGAEDVIITTDEPDPYFYYYSGPAPLAFVPLEAEKIAADFSRAAGGKERAFVIQWFRKNPNPWGILTSLVAGFGDAVEGKKFQGYTVQIYSLENEIPLMEEGRWQKFGIHFGDVVLQEAAYAGQVSDKTREVAQIAAGGWGWVALRWQATKDLATNYSTTVLLLEGAGRLIAQNDKPLFNFWLLPSEHWKPGEEGITLHLLHLPEETSPGEYQIVIGLYETSTLSRLGGFSPDGQFLGDLVPLGSVVVTGPD